MNGVVKLHPHFAMAVISDSRLARTVQFRHQKCQIRSAGLNQHSSCARLKDLGRTTPVQTSGIELMSKVPFHPFPRDGKVDVTPLNFVKARAQLRQLPSRENYAPRPDLIAVVNHLFSDDNLVTRSIGGSRNAVFNIAISDIHFKTITGCNHVAVSVSEMPDDSL